MNRREALSVTHRVVVTHYETPWGLLRWSKDEDKMARKAIRRKNGMERISFGYTSMLLNLCAISVTLN